MSQSTPGKRVFLALPRLSSRGSTHTTVARWTALWESLGGKPRGKDSRESLRFLHPREGKRDTTATAREESARACPYSRRGMTHTTVARWTAIWESLVGKPRGKDSGESHRFLHPREGKRDTTATAREESARACPNSRRGLTPLGRLQKYPRNHVSTGVESSGSCTDSTQGLRPQHRRERNPERPHATSMGTGLS